LTDPAFIECQNCATRLGVGAPYLCTSCLNNREAISLLLGVLKEAEKIEGWPDHFYEKLRPVVVKLHKAIRKAKGMS